MGNNQQQLKHWISYFLKVRGHYIALFNEIDEDTSLKTLPLGVILNTKRVGARYSIELLADIFEKTHKIAVKDASSLFGIGKSDSETRYTSSITESEIIEKLVGALKHYNVAVAQLYVTLLKARHALTTLPYNEINGRERVVQPAYNGSIKLKEDRDFASDKISELRKYIKQPTNNTTLTPNAKKHLEILIFEHENLTTEMQDSLLKLFEEAKDQSKCLKDHYHDFSENRDQIKQLIKEDSKTNKSNSKFNLLKRFILGMIQLVFLLVALFQLSEYLG